ncbi:MAG: hypothetical protein GY874_09615 [Desulfobacteraceae bacterium]|nr:hypothetical protein [Desulfobacteraceae bacterium]
MNENENVSRDVIKEAVLDKLESLARPKQTINEQMHFQQDLDLGTSFKAALSLPFSKISNCYGGQTVSSTETKMLEIVKNAIDLVYKKANRKA